MTKKEIAQDFLKLAAKGESREAFRRYAGNGFKRSPRLTRLRLFSRCRTVGSYSSMVTGTSDRPSGSITCPSGKRWTAFRLQHQRVQYHFRYDVGTFRSYVK